MFELFGWTNGNTVAYHNVCHQIPPATTRSVNKWAMFSAAGIEAASRPVREMLPVSKAVGYT